MELKKTKKKHIRKVYKWEKSFKSDDLNLRGQILKLAEPDGISENKMMEILLKFAVKNFKNREQ